MGREAARLDRIFHMEQPVWGRSEYDSAYLNQVVAVMRGRRRELNIPNRDIAIIAYLARNPHAIIFHDKNVSGAFQSARRALETPAKSKEV